MSQVYFCSELNRDCPEPVTFTDSASEIDSYLHSFPFEIKGERYVAHFSPGTALSSIATAFEVYNNDRFATERLSDQDYCTNSVAIDPILPDLLSVSLLPFSIDRNLFGELVTGGNTGYLPRCSDGSSVLSLNLIPGALVRVAQQHVEFGHLPNHQDVILGFLNSLASNFWMHEAFHGYEYCQGIITQETVRKANQLSVRRYLQLMTNVFVIASFTGLRLSSETLFNMYGQGFVYGAANVGSSVAIAYLVREIVNKRSRYLAGYQSIPYENRAFDAALRFEGQIPCPLSFSKD